MLLRVKKQTVAFHRGWDLEAEAGNDMIIFLSLFRQVGSWGWLTGHVGRQETLGVYQWTKASLISQKVLSNTRSTIPITFRICKIHSLPHLTNIYRGP